MVGPGRVVGIGLGCVLLTGFFILLGFPYDRLGQTLAAHAQRSTGTEIAFQDFGPYLSWRGPGVQATGLRVVTAAGERWSVERVRLGPGWSLSWLRLAPAVHVDLDGLPGRVVGTAVLGARAGFDGELIGVDLSQLPALPLGPNTRLAGTVDATVDLHRNTEGPEGRVDLKAKSGSLAFPGLPTPIPFQDLSANLEFGGEQFVELETLELEGPVVSATGQGRIAQAASFSDAALDLELDVQAKPRLQPVLRNAGIRLSRDGRAQLRIRGTPSRPQLR